MQSSRLVAGSKEAYGSQISQTVYYLLGHPLWVDRRRLAPGMQIISLWSESVLQASPHGQGREASTAHILCLQCCSPHRALGFDNLIEV